MYLIVVDMLEWCYQLVLVDTDSSVADWVMVHLWNMDFVLGTLLG